MLCEIARTNGGVIKSGWRSICSAAVATRVSPPPRTPVSDQEVPMPKILEIVTLFINSKGALVFSQAAVNCILCLSKCLHVSIGSEDGLGDDRSPHESETSSNVSEGPYGDMCVSALDLLSKISERLASIYVKPANVIFHGSHSVKMDDSSSSSPSLPIMSKVDTVEDPSTPSSGYASSVTTMDDSGILRVWYLTLDVLTSTVITCPGKFQLQALDMLFDVLYSISSVPGPHFSILVCTNLLLPMLHNWLERGRSPPNTGNERRATSNRHAG